MRRPRDATTRSTGWAAYLDGKHLVGGNAAAAELKAAGLRILGQHLD